MNTQFCNALNYFFKCDSASRSVCTEITFVFMGADESLIPAVCLEPAQLTAKVVIRITKIFFISICIMVRLIYEISSKGIYFNRIS